MTVESRRKKGRAKQTSLRRLLLFALGLAIAGAVLFALLTGGPAERSAPLPANPPDAEPHADIGPESRAKLREILREADDPDSQEPR